MIRVCIIKKRIRKTIQNTIPKKRIRKTIPKKRIQKKLPKKRIRKRNKIQRSASPKNGIRIYMIRVYMIKKIRRVQKTNTRRENIQKKKIRKTRTLKSRGVRTNNKHERYLPLQDCSKHGFSERPNPASAIESIYDSNTSLFDSNSILQKTVFFFFFSFFHFHKFECFKTFLSIITQYQLH